VVGAVLRTTSQAGATEANGLGKRGGGQTVLASTSQSGQGYRGGQGQAAPLEANTVNSGRGARRNVQENAGNQAPESAPGDQAGTGQAQVDEWVILEGTVVSVNEDAMIVQTTSGEQITVENRVWWFALEQGFSANAGDEVTLTGFYESGDFETGVIDNTSTGQSVTLRDESGRPLWAGRGRRGG